MSISYVIIWAMAVEIDKFAPDNSAPKENFARGNLTLDLPEGFGDKFSGKNTDFWIVDDRVYQFDSDRISAKNRIIGTVPGVGAIEGSISRWWKTRTKHIVDNDHLGSPDPTVSIVKKAAVRLDVEFIFRSFFVKSSSKTSLYYKYHTDGRRNIYGYDFPDGMQDNQELPMGTIFTPTTKGDLSDDEITPDQAREIINRQANRENAYDEAMYMLDKLNQMGQDVFGSRGLLLVDTKYEVGIDKDGSLMVIDKIHTPHSSRIWIKGDYGKALKGKRMPESLDTENLRIILAEKGFDGNGPVPKLSSSDINFLSRIYRAAYTQITGQKELPRVNSLEEIRRSVIEYAQNS